MKIIITENQIEKTKKLVNVMFDKGHTIDNIKRYTGLPTDILIMSLKDRKFFKRGLFCDEKADMLYDYLFHTDLINKEHIYDDGSKIYIEYGYSDGTIYFNYIDENEDILNGYATFLWDRSCHFPIDSVDLTRHDEDEPDQRDFYYGDLDEFMFGDFLDILTINDLATWFNQNYFKDLKPALKTLIDRF